MTKAPAEMMREFVKSQNFTTTDEVMAAMKEMFKDVFLFCVDGLTGFKQAIEAFCKKR